MELTPKTFKELADVIRNESGIVLGPEKAYLVRHRLEPLLRDNGLEGYDDLMRRLRVRTAVALRNTVIDAMTVKETRFFRDQSFFELLRTHVFPSCATTMGKGRHRLRIWSAAASTGQEAYSVAMLMREFIASGATRELDEGRVNIVASDISASAIELAKAGLYANAAVHRGVSDERLRKHFHRSGQSWRVDESLQRMMQFRTFNLQESPAGLGAFDVILCRNVMIYFDEPTRRRICRELHDSLQPGGWLALGSAESLYGMEERFETVVIGKAIVYRRPQRAG